MRAFGPHPDDVELFCGGLLARLGDQGYRVGVVDLTRGERASRGTPETRAGETAAASRILGLDLRENLGLPDAGLRADDEAQVLAVVLALRRQRPEFVLAPWERERHPDHEATSALVTRAVFLAGLRKFECEPPLPPSTPRQVLYYPLRQLATPSFVVDTTAAAERKMAAVGCYQSQVGPLGESQPPTLVGSALSLSSLDARDRFYGAQIGAAHGEPYLVRNALGLLDPLAHFRANALASPLFFPEGR